MNANTHNYTLVYLRLEEAVARFPIGLRLSLYRACTLESGMKSTNLVLTALILLSLTFVVAAQSPLGNAPPNQPSIALDFAQYCVGDSWKLNLSSSAPNAS